MPIKFSTKKAQSPDLSAFPFSYYNPSSKSTTYFRKEKAYLKHLEKLGMSPETLKRGGRTKQYEEKS